MSILKWKNPEDNLKYEDSSKDSKIIYKKYILDKKVNLEIDETKINLLYNFEFKYQGSIII